MATETYASWEDAGIRPNSTSRQHKMTCPKCGGKNALSVNPAKDAFKCHRPSCDWKGWIGERGKPPVTNAEWKPLPNRSTELAPDTAQGHRMIHDWLHNERGLPLEVILNNPDLGVQQWTFDGKQKLCVAFRFWDGDNLMMCKVRPREKDFGAYPGGTEILYRLNHAKYADEIIITEGEIDALSFVAAGFQNATSLPNGASGKTEMKWLGNCMEWLEMKSRIYIALDDDEAGQKDAREIARRLGMERCWLVTYPDGCKDANDVLVLHGAASLKTCIENARPFPVQGINLINDLYSEVMGFHVNGFPKGSETGTALDKFIRWLPGELTVWTGHANHGKTPFLSNVLMRLALNGGNKWGVFTPEYVNFGYYAVHLVEMLTGKQLPRNNTMYSMTQAEVKAACDWLNRHVFEIRPADELYTLDEVFDKAKLLVEMYGITDVVIDHWKKFYFPNKNDTRINAREMLNRSKAFGVKYGVHVHLVAHPLSKRAGAGTGAGGHNLDKITNLTHVSESDDFYNLADNGIAIHRQFKPELEDGKRVDDHTIAGVLKVKNRWVGECGECYWKFDVRTNRYYEMGTQPDMKSWVPHQVSPEARQLFDQYFPDSEPEPSFDDKAPF